MEISHVPEGEPIEHRILSRQIESAQKKVEEMNFISRKHVLKYDEVMNKQRQVIYEQRRRVLDGEDLSEEIKGWITQGGRASRRQLHRKRVLGGVGRGRALRHHAGAYGSTVTAEELKEDEVPLERMALVDEFRLRRAWTSTRAKEEEFEQLQPDLMRDLERFILLQVVDNRWREHLDNMDYLREGVHLRAMAQKDPLVEYTAEGHKMFEELSAVIREEWSSRSPHSDRPQEAQAFVEADDPSSDTTPGMGLKLRARLGGRRRGDPPPPAKRPGADGLDEARPRQASAQQRVVSEHEKLGRNDPCWCGSGKKLQALSRRLTQPERRWTAG